MLYARLQLVVALAAIVAIGCESSPSAAQAPAAAPAAAPAGPGAGSDQVVAEVNGRPITLAEVDAKWQEFDAAEARASRSFSTRAAATCSTSCWETC